MELTKRQEDIVQTAIEIIARRGFKALTTKNLAQSLGLTEAALYRHFDSKKELINQILIYFENLSCQILEEIAKLNLGPMENIRRFMMNRYLMFSADPDLARVMFSEEPFAHDPAFRSQMRRISGRHRDAVISYLEAGQKLGQINPDLEACQLFRIVVGSMRYTVNQWNMGGQSFDLVAQGEKLFQTIKTMIQIKNQGD